MFKQFVYVVMAVAASSVFAGVGSEGTGSYAKTGPVRANGVGSEGTGSYAKTNPEQSKLNPVNHSTKPAR